MNIVRNLIIMMFMLIVTVYSVFPGGKSEKTTQGESGGDSDEKEILLQDFEDPGLSMRLYQGNSSIFTVEITSEEKYQGKQSAKVTAETKDWTGVEIAVPEYAGDWSEMKAIKMWIKGQKTGTEIKVVVEDSGKEQFTQSIIDTRDDWHQFTIPIAGFISRTDFQNEGASVNNLIDYPVTFLHFFTANEGNVVLYVDQITLSDTVGEIEKVEQMDYIVPRKEPVQKLRDLAEYKNLDFGAGVSVNESENGNVAGILARDFSSITAENEMKFYFIKKEEDVYNFEPADKIVEVAKKNNMKIRGHALIWHPYLPEWLFNKEWTKKEMLAMLKEYITTVVSRYKGKIYAWDVVNEVFNDDGRLRDKDSIWYQVCGDEYIEKAFIWAHEADPGALLFINDYNVAEFNAKSTATYDLIKKLRAKGVPIHGFGAQMHLIEDDPPSYRRIYDNMKRFSELGMEIHFTEMDVRIKGKITEEKLLNQGKIYSEIIRIAMAFDSITSVTTWGVSDKFSWIPSTFPGYKSALLFDDNFNPKPAYFDIQLALLRGPGELEYLAENTDRHMAPPFKAMAARIAPKCDGIRSPGEWDSAVVYPFGFDQLNGFNLSLPAKSDIDGTWRILYKGNRMYGLVERKDDRTKTNVKDSWENDNVEVFFDIDNDFTQLRTIVRRDFEENAYKGERKAVWSMEGDVLEFYVDLPPRIAPGNIIGWNIALSDNDGQSTRDCQLYPVNGKNKSYKGIDLGEIEFVSTGKTPERLGVEHIMMPFFAAFAEQVPVIDGTEGNGEWKGAITYPFAYNQLNKGDLTLPDPENISGTWSILYRGNVIYGLIKRQDNTTVTTNKNTRDNDALDIYISMNNSFIHCTSIVNREFESDPYKGKKTIIWNEAGNVAEFSIEMPPKTLKNLIVGFNISLTDNDGAALPEYRLFPVVGSNKSDKGEELAELSFLE